jgi:hypothetical protein
MWRKCTVALILLSAVWHARASEVWLVRSASLGGAGACPVDQRLSAPFLLAELKERREKALLVLLYGHCIGHGKDNVIHYEEFHPSPPNVVDADKFLQLTLSVPRLPIVIGEFYDLDGSEAKLYFSEGSSVWLEKGYGRYGDRATGRIRVEAIAKNAIRVTANLELTTRDVLEDRIAKRPIQFENIVQEVSLTTASRCFGTSVTCADMPHLPKN